MFCFLNFLIIVLILSNILGSLSLDCSGVMYGAIITVFIQGMSTITVSGMKSLYDLIGISHFSFLYTATPPRLLLFIGGDLPTNSQFRTLFPF